MASELFTEKYDVAAEMESSILGKAKNFTVSTIADFGATLWNSLPFTPDIRTEEILGKIDEDALGFYQQNKDAVELTSLIGGSFVPGGVALKLLGRARSGVTSLGLSEGFVGGSFTGARQTKLASEIEEAFRVAGPGWKEFQSHKRQLFASNATQQVLDNALIELAVVGAMNAHPMMQDYIDDFGKNFAIGVAAGGVLGGLFSIPTSVRSLRQASAASERGFTIDILDRSGFKPVPEGLSASSEAIAYKENIDNLEKLIVSKETDDYGRQMAVHLHTVNGARYKEAITRAFPQYTEMSPDGKKVIEEIVLNPEFSHVDKIRFLNMDKADKYTANVLDYNKLPDDLKNFLDADGKSVVVFVRPSTGEVFASRGVRSAATAADLKNPLERAKEGAKLISRSYTDPVNDFVEGQLIRSVSSAETDLRYITELLAVDKMDLETLKRINVAPDDLPRMHALAVKLAKLSQEERDQLKIKVTRNTPSFTAQQTVIKKLINEEHVWPQNYSTDVVRVSEERAYTFMDQNLSKEAKQLLGVWVHGHYEGKSVWDLYPTASRTGIDSVKAGESLLRRAMGKVFQGTPLPKGEEHLAVVAEEIYRAGQSFRDALRPLANSEGDVLLYRGLRASQAAGHAPVESYSTKEHIARRFAGSSGTVLVKRVPIEDVIGTLGSGPANEAEILVRAPQQKGVAGGAAGVRFATPGQKSQMTEHIETLLDDANTAPGVAQLGGEEFIDAYFAAATDTAATMLAQPIKAGATSASLEEVSARLNITKDKLSAMMLGEKIETFHDFRYRSVDAIQEYLGPGNKLIALFGNPRKAGNAEEIANLDRRQLAGANRQNIEEFTLQSNSPIGKKIFGLYESKGAQLAVDGVVAELGTIVNSLVGNHRWQSADQALRALAIGPMIVGSGKRFTNAVDQLKEEILVPLAQSFQVMQNKPAALSELNVVLNKLAGLKGWREIVTGEDGITTIVQRTGKKSKEGLYELEPVVGDDGLPFTVKQDEVKQALEAMRKPAAALLETHNLNKTITGDKPLTDLGFYVPPISLVGKNFSFVFDKTGVKPTELLVANSAEELKSLEQAWKAANGSEIRRYDLITKGEQEDHNLFKEYQDYEAYTTYANVAYQHKGASAQAILPSDFRMIENMMQSYENLIIQSARKYHQHYLHDVTSWLDDLSSFYRREVSGQPKLPTQKETAKDAALQVKNILLGRDQLESTGLTKQINTLYELGINRAVQTLDNYVKTSSGRKQTTKEYFDNLVGELTEKGITNPWKTFDEYLATTSSDARNIAPVVQSVGNGLIATLNLRMFDIAQAAVNMMSLPILTWGALMEKMPGTVTGNTSVKFPLRTMYDGIRFMNAPEGAALNRMWESEGLINQAVRQYTELSSDLKKAYLGGRFSDKALSIANGIQDNKIVKDYLAKPADWAEMMTRKIAMNVGYMAAKQAYPQIDDFAGTIAAMHFADRAIGNYHASQRPTFFHGTFGAAIGLYQTYFLTYAQQVYRGIENRNFKQLAAVASAQAGIFGMSSWPGYNLLSEQVVSQFSDKHWDITSGTYRAVGDPAAEVILYGLPSSLGPAIYTRGDVSPRIPTGFQDIALYNNIRQGWDAAAGIVERTASGLQNGNLGQSMLEALSLQSINRPIARWAEIAAGESVTRQGNTVSPSSEVWTPTGVASRLIATRPLEEQVVRNTIRANKMYKEMDFENRQAAVEKLKVAIRNGNLDSELVSKTALVYFKKGGTADGWNSAMNELFVKAEQGARMDLLRKLEPDSPLRRMVSDLY